MKKMNEFDLAKLAKEAWDALDAINAKLDYLEKAHAAAEKTAA